MPGTSQHKAGHDASWAEAVAIGGSFRRRDVGAAAHSRHQVTGVPLDLGKDLDGLADGIDPASDAGDRGLGSVRIHIPITTNAAVEFELNRRRVILEAGSCWYLRLSDPHRVANRGDTDRIHMVIDATVNEWIEAIFARASAG